MMINDEHLPMPARTPYETDLTDAERADRLHAAATPLGH
jgi:hypothetical protein